MTCLYDHLKHKRPVDSSSTISSLLYKQELIITRGALSLYINTKDDPEQNFFSSSNYQFIFELHENIVQPENCISLQA